MSKNIHIYLPARLATIDAKRAARKTKDGRSKAEVTAELDAVSAKIEKCQDQGVTVPSDLAAKQKALQAELKTTKDAGEFKEGDHPRGKGGQFATSGAAGGTAEHHSAKSLEHYRAALNKGNGHPDNKHHLAAMKAHSAAGGNLVSAEWYSKHKAQPKHPEHNPTDLTAKANLYASRAAHHEAKLGGGKKPDQHVIARTHAQSILAGPGSPGFKAAVTSQKKAPITGKGPALREKPLPGEVDKHGHTISGAFESIRAFNNTHAQHKAK